jgi:hypothetical protein
MATAASLNLRLHLRTMVNRARMIESCRRAVVIRSVSSIRSFSTGIDIEHKRGLPPLERAGKDAPASERIFVHISPSGDFWLGEAIFAAKHLSSDYLRSIPLQSGSDADQVERQMEKLTTSQLQAIYDSGDLQRCLPHDARP